MPKCLTSNSTREIGGRAEYKTFTWILGNAHCAALAMSIRKESGGSLAAFIDAQQQAATIGGIAARRANGCIEYLEMKQNFVSTIAE
jgi:hypothetical protein